MSEIVTIEGTCRWAKVFEHNRDPGGTNNGNTFPEATTIEVVLDQDELRKLSKVHTDVSPKMDDDGMFVKIRRRWFNPNPSRGGAPKVVDADGNVMDGQVLIGDGSKVKVAVEVYKTKHGTAARLAGVQVLELKEYVSEGGEAEELELPF